jgi:hypothetical protein
MKDNKDYKLGNTDNILIEPLHQAVLKTRYYLKKLLEDLMLTSFSAIQWCELVKS